MWLVWSLIIGWCTHLFCKSQVEYKLCMRLNNTQLTSHITSYCTTNILLSSVKMSSSQTTTTNGEVVINHVYPYGYGMGVAVVASAPHCLGQTVSSVLGSFRAGHPKALGVRIYVLYHLKIIFHFGWMYWKKRKMDFLLCFSLTDHTDHDWFDNAVDRNRDDCRATSRQYWSI